VQDPKEVAGRGDRKMRSLSGKLVGTQHSRNLRYRHQFYARGLGRVFKVARLEKTVDVDVYVDELVEVGVAWPIEV